MGQRWSLGDSETLWASYLFPPHLPRPPALGPVRPRRRSLGERTDTPRAPRQFAHPGLGAKAAGEEAGD